MKQKELDHFRQLLRKQAERLRSSASATGIEVQKGSGGQAAGELTNAPLHLGDRGTEEYLHEMNTAVLENEEYLGNEAVAALNRIEAGTFGICERCGREIPRDRLEAIPYTRYCVPCSEAEEAGLAVNLNEGRPRGPRDTLAPEGEMNEDGSKRSDPHEGGGQADVHAAGTAGGGAAEGGLAGGTAGRGEPDVAVLNEALASGYSDVKEVRQDERKKPPRGGKSGGAVGGTPARKRAN
jgi:RNA polymerase-binding transcription factor DksA